jgi:DNA-binding response OmpR family regulator
MRLLLIEDDKKIALFVKTGLRESGMKELLRPLKAA